MRLIDAEDAINQVAMIAKAFAKSDKQKALCGRIIYTLEHRPTVKAIPIPNGATNGEVMMAIFEEIQYYSDGRIDANWWNAPYKSEVRE